MEDKFDGIELKHIPRKLNQAEDSLAKKASRPTLTPQVDVIEIDPAPSVGPRAASNPGVEVMEIDPVTNGVDPSVHWRNVYI